MAIYTKTGDKGKTSLFGGKRVSKADLRVEAYGEMDELNSLIGTIIVQSSKLKVKSYSSKLKNELIKIQQDLLEIGSMLANTVSKSEGLEKRVIEIEKLIDELSKNIPELKNFILPGGGEIGSFLHFARSVTRRVERKIVALNKKDPSAGSGQGKIDPQILAYFNRLSDLFFIMARFANYKEKKREIIWPR